MNEPPALRSSDDSAARRRAPVIVAVVGGAILAGAIAAVVLLNLPRATTSDAGASATPTPAGSVAASESAVPTQTPVAAARATATPEPSPSAPAGAAAMDWTAGTPPDGTVNDIIWLGDRWLAAGSSGAGRTRAATWTSVDGVSWRAGAQIGPDPVQGVEGRSFWMTRALLLADEVIGFGWQHIGCCDGGRAALWRSTDGETWTYVDTAGTEYDTIYHAPFDAAVAPTGELVLVSGVGLGTGTTVFTSNDATTWVERPLDAAEDMIINRLAASDELLVGVGLRFTEGSEPVVWTSIDGRSWSDASPPADGGALADVAWDAEARRFVVVGSDANGRPAAWLTEDGTGWSRTTLASEEGSATSVSADAGLIVAVGTTGTHPDDELIAWSSFDALTWQVMPLMSTIGSGARVATADERAVLHVSVTGREPDYAIQHHVWSGSLAD